MAKSVEKKVGRSFLTVETEEKLTGVYKKLKAYGDILMSTDKNDAVELDGETLSTIGGELFEMGQTVEAIVCPDVDYPDDEV